MKNKELLKTMADELCQVALSYDSGSNEEADTLLQEILLKETQLESDKFPESVAKVLFWTSDLPYTEDLHKRAEDALLYSTLLQSFAK